jgi:hypothetical protein
MKRTTIPALGVILLCVILSCLSCKKAEVGTGTLTVIVSEGVSGNPVTGTYEVQVGSTWTYSYSLGAGYEKLTVLLDGATVAASGSFTVSGDHKLQAYSDDNLQYTLNVTWGNGVTGTPTAGTYQYKQGAQVPYSYALADGYTNLSVKLNGTAIIASGSITMSADHALYAGAEAKSDVRGSWKLSESYNDGSSFEVTVTFSGTLASGTVTDSEGGAGTYTFNDDNTVDFTLVFPDVTYEYSDGDFADSDTMSGDCRRYQNTDNAVAGTWTATRVTSSTASRRHAGAKGQGRFVRSQ